MGTNPVLYRQTFVVNHDTQEGQASECLVSPWFIPHAYSLILLHTNGGTPIVFYGDLYGSFGPMGPRPAGTFEPVDHGRRLIPRIMLARQNYANGAQSEYFDDDAECIGFTRHGDATSSGGGAGLAVIMTSRCESRATKRMFVGAEHAGETWTDLFGKVQDVVKIDAEGRGVFITQPRAVSVWVNIVAKGRADVEAFNL